MNIQINTNTKVIKIAETVNFKELMEVLDKLFPNKEWMEYKLETNTIIQNWTNPIIINKGYPYWWNQPYYITNEITLTPTITSNNTYSKILSGDSGTYNFNVNSNES